MVENSEYDALGELFRRKLEDHRVEVDSDGWKKIERSLGNDPNDKPNIIWLWRIAAMVAAASVAALLLFNDSNAPESGDSLISELQDTVRNVASTRNAEPVSATPANEDVAGQSGNEEIAIGNVASFRHAELVAVSPANEDIVGQSGNDASAIGNDTDAVRSITQSYNDSINLLISYLIAKNDSIKKIISYSDIEEILFEDETDDNTSKRWLLAAVFGIGSYNNGIDASQSSGVSKSSIAENSSGNIYATGLSSNIMSFDNMNEDDFTNISHSPPFSLGIKARTGGSDKNAGIETGLIYTYLSSRYKWSNHNVFQGLHYIGIPVNFVGYLGNSKTGAWRFYFSGGFMVEKGLRAIYRQERTWIREHRYTTVKSSINGLQWSLNGAMGISHKLEKGFGIYFEPSVGYSFKNNQPVSIRTQMPVYIGISLGINYEL